MIRVEVGGIPMGDGCPLGLIAGPCVLEDRDHALRLAEALRDAVAGPFIFKASYDKANRTSMQGYRGPGLDRGLAILAEIRSEVGVPILTDVHTPAEAVAAAEVVDILQVPAFLCRQTDLVIAAAATGRPVNFKKGQFLAPDDMRFVVQKAESTGHRRFLLTERGTAFGYHDLIADLRSLVILREAGYPVVFDATHSVQRPGGACGSSGGDGRFVPHLARAAAAVGCDALYMEVHDHPADSPSDRSTIFPLADLPRLLAQVRDIHQRVRDG